MQFKKHPILNCEKRVLYFLLHILQCLIHFIHILSDSLLRCTNLAHTVSLAELVISD